MIGVSNPPISTVDNQLKQLAYQRLLKRAQKSLSPLERPASNFVHTDIVNALSEALATLGRPLALLWAGLATFAGSIIYWTTSLMNGSGYDYSLPLLFLAGGYAFGCLLEVIYRLRFND